MLSALVKIRKIPSYIRTRGLHATVGRLLYVLRSGEVFHERFVGYETPAWPLSEIEYRPLSSSMVMRFHCDFPSLSGVSIHVRASRGTRLSLVLADASGAVARRCSIRCSRVARDYLALFRFRTLFTSEGKDFTVSLTSTPPEAAFVAVNPSCATRLLDAAEGIPESRFYCSDRLLSQYGLWIRRNEPSASVLAELRMQDSRHGPLISIAVPVYKTPLDVLNAMVASVVDQTWPRWELCIANAGSREDRVGQALDQWARKDDRIHVVHLGENRGIAGNTNTALGLVHGAYVALLDHDDTLAPFALSSMAKAIAESGQPDMLYSDEDKLDGASGRRIEPFFKPDWSPHLLMSANYVTHFLCMRKELIDAVDGLRPGFDGSQDYDLILRCSERARQVVHIPQVLYHWRTGPSSTAGNTGAKLYAYEAGREALTEHLARTGLGGEVVRRAVSGHYRVHLDSPKELAVSVIIPSHDNPRMLAKAVKSALGATPSVREVLVLENGSKRPDTFALYRQIGQIDRVHVLDYGTRPFNYSLINNWGATQANGKALLFLNDDVHARSSDWLREMAQWLTDPTVGAVGARLLYPDGSVQHNGVALGMGGVAGHRGQRASEAEEATQDMTSGDVRDVSATTAACLLVRNTAFHEVGGFDEAFPLAFGDVDLCLRLCERGYQIVCTPDARLVCVESATRGSDLSADKLSAFLEATRLMRSRWGAELDSDPFYSPNLTLNESLPRIRMT
jgi:GT2 family glycosyltransferase